MTNQNVNHGSANQAGLIACEHCSTLSPLSSEEPSCPQCGSRLHSRKSDSLGRTWALLIAASILYIPANLLPVMKTSNLFGTQKDTILSGVVYFWSTGSQGLAALIFFVSILVPILKVASLSYLLVTVGRKSPHKRQQRARMFRVIEFIGRWSMLDVFVVALMVGLVRFRSLAVIEAGSGAIAFGAVVVLTMLAAHSFDPRLIWDTDEKADD
jgi:paraquat-inducible protein A